MAPPAFPRPAEPTRPGPKRVPVAEKRRKTRDAPVKAARRRPTNQKKIEVLTFLDTPREFPAGDGRIETRKPTTREAGAFYGVHSSQVTRWRQQEESLLQSIASGRAIKRKRAGKWPKMEQDLYDEYMENRQEGKVVGEGWFRLAATRLHAEHYPEETPFRFSAGWFHNFLKRYCIQFISKKTREIPTKHTAEPNDHELSGEEHDDCEAAEFVDARDGERDESEGAEEEVSAGVHSARMLEESVDIEDTVVGAH